MYLFQLARLLDRPKTGEDRVEEVQQNQRCVLVKEELTVPCSIALGASRMELLQDRVDHFKELEPFDVLGFDFRLIFRRHGLSASRCEHA